MIKSLFNIVFLLIVFSVFADSSNLKYSKVSEIKQDKTLNKLSDKLNIQEYAISEDDLYLLVLRKEAEALEIISAADFSFIKSLPIMVVETATPKIDFCIQC